VVNWIAANPNAAIALAVAASGITLAMVRFALLRHREYIVFMKHVEREEKEVWPALDHKITLYHGETLALFSDHGERLASLEAKMPNGQLDEMQRTLDTILARLK